jgi:hypothetical protein
MMRVTSVGMMMLLLLLMMMMMAYRRYLSAHRRTVWKHSSAPAGVRGTLPRSTSPDEPSSVMMSPLRTVWPFVVKTSFAMSTTIWWHLWDER